MNQSVSLVTIGVADYERARSFYEAIGWSAALEIEETAFFQANGVVLVLWSREKLAADTGVADDGAAWSGITLAHNVGSRADVDAVVEKARERRHDQPGAGRDVQRRLRRRVPRPRRARVGGRTQPG